MVVLWAEAVPEEAQGGFHALDEAVAKVGATFKGPAGEGSLVGLIEALEQGLSSLGHQVCWGTVAVFLITDERVLVAQCGDLVIVAVDEDGRVLKRSKPHIYYEYPEYYADSLQLDRHARGRILLGGLSSEGRSIDTEEWSDDAQMTQLMVLAGEYLPLEANQIGSLVYPGERAEFCLPTIHSY